MRLYKGGSGGEEFHGADCAYGVYGASDWVKDAIDGNMRPPTSSLTTSSSFDVKEAESPEAGRQNSAAKAENK